MSGSECQIIGTKWDGSPHFAIAARFLGADDGGAWLGAASGWRMARATQTLHIPYSSVFYVPDGHGYLARFDEPGVEAGTDLYVDITTVPVWRATEAQLVDLDLDIVRDRQGRLRVVDEGEFVANSKRLNYPSDLIAAAYKPSPMSSR